MEKEQPTDDSPRHSFRVVGGADAAKVEVQPPVSGARKAVALTSVRPDRFLVVPVRDVPTDGFSLREDGYEALAGKGRAEALLGPNAYLDSAVWAEAISRVKSGGKVMLVLGQDPIDVEGEDEKKFPVEIEKNA